MLTAYFEKNRADETARGILYRDFPSSIQGKHRVNSGKIGYVVIHYDRSEESCLPIQPRGSITILGFSLNHVADATSFKCLRIVDGKLLPTFRKAVERRGLIEENNTLDESLAEATGWMMSYALRRLFATILVFCEPSNMFGLWKKHKEAISEDYRHNNQSTFMVE
jgi:hypothetical protein